MSDSVKRRDRGLDHTAKMRLGLGTATLVGGRSIREARRLIESTLEVGITHFDTARIYGFGESERVLGDVLKGVSNVTLASKAGLGRAVQVRGVWRFDALAMAARDAIPLRARTAQRQIRWDKRYLERSITTSLELLRRDRLDFLLLHEIAYEEWSTEVQGVVDGFVRAGRIAAAGLATRTEELERFVTAGPVPGDVCQFAGGPLQRQLQLGGIATTIWHSIFGTGGQTLATFVSWLEAEPTLKSLWNGSTAPREVGLQILRYVAGAEVPSILILPVRQQNSLIAAVEAARAPLPRDEHEAMSVIFDRFRNEFMKRVKSD